MYHHPLSNKKYWYLSGCVVKKYLPLESVAVHNTLPLILISDGFSSQDVLSVAGGITLDTADRS